MAAPAYSICGRRMTISTRSWSFSPSSIGSRSSFSAIFRRWGKDKRIILLEGEPLGAVLRVPPAGEARANLHVAGKAVKTTLTAREREICAALGPTLREQGLLFVGLDVIGDHLTEINVTSPTGIQEINRLDGVRLESRVWDAIEARLAARGGRASA